MMRHPDPNRGLKLGLGITASGALAIGGACLPSSNLLAQVGAIALPTLGFGGSIAGIAKANEYEQQDRIEAESRERWQALQQDMDDAMLLSSQAFYTAHPGAWTRKLAVPDSWHEQYMRARYTPLPELQPTALQPTPQEVIEQRPATVEKQPGLTRGGSFDVADGFIPQHPAAPPSFAAPVQNTARRQASHTPRLFDWATFQRDPDRFAHACVVGATGDGKTTLQEYITRLIASGNELVLLTTKRKSDQWVGLHPVGLGRNFAAISSEWQGLESTLDRRCLDLDRSQQLPQIAIAIDELNDIIANSEVDLANVARAGREPRMRLIVNSHSEGVEGLGLKGKNELKHCFTWVRLGQFALRHGQQLANKGLLSQPDFDWLRKQARPCMVNDAIAKVPDLSPEWQLRLCGSQPQPPEARRATPEPTTLPSFDLDRPIQVHDSFVDVQTPEPAKIEPSAQPEPETDREAELLQQFAEFKALGMNKAQIVFAIWHAKKGGSAAYRTASEFYDRLLIKYQEINGENAA